MPFRFECPDRDPLERALAPLSLNRKRTPTDAWRDLSPEWPGDGSSAGDNEWVCALSDDQPLPLYLPDPHRHYWFEYLADDKAVYFQYDRSQDTPEGASFAEFAEEVEAFIGWHPTSSCVNLRTTTSPAATPPLRPYSLPSIETLPALR